jgi:hypothetical protein
MIVDNFCVIFEQKLIGVIDGLFLYFKSILKKIYIIFFFASN